MEYKYIKLDNDNKFDGESKVIKNVANPVDDNDAVNKQHVVASLTPADTINFDGVLSASEDTVQKALDTLDDVVKALTVKTLYFQVSEVAAYGDYKVAALGVDANMNMTFTIPADFVSLISLEAIYIPTAAIVGETIDLNSDYGAIGELSNLNSESSLGVTINASANTITAQDISSVCISLAAGDFVGINWKNNAVGTTVNMLMVRIKYNSI